jgi:hypothetical protein
MGDPLCGRQHLPGRRQQVVALPQPASWLATGSRRGAGTAMKMSAATKLRSRTPPGGAVAAVAAAGCGNRRWRCVVTAGSWFIRPVRPRRCDHGPDPLPHKLGGCSVVAVRSGLVHEPAPGSGVGVHRQASATAPGGQRRRMKRRARSGFVWRRGEPRRRTAQRVQGMPFQANSAVHTTRNAIVPAATAWS